MMMDGVTALAVLAIASFAIDRLVTGLLFLLSFSSAWTRHFPIPDTIVDDKQSEEEESKPDENSLVTPDGTPVETEEEKDAPDEAVVPAKIRRIIAERRLKLAYYIIAGLFGGVVLAYLGEVRVFRAVGFVQTNALLDCVMTGLILSAGADRMSGFLNLPGSQSPKQDDSKPIQISGTLKLEGDTLSH